MKNLVILIAGAGALAACAPGDPTSVAFNSEAGTAYNDGGFGNATMNNVLLQSGQADYRISLANRFAAEAPSMVNFAFNSAQLDAEAQGILRQQADWIRQFPEVRFRVYGHTDAVGSGSYNRALGQRRAEAVVAYLATLGISRTRLEAIASFGEDQPLVVTQGQERRNRRTVTEVSGFVESHPGVLNGRYAEIIFREYVGSAVPQPVLPVADASGEGTDAG
jgi:peptidoglycan-associated lipoprotein